MGKRGPFDKGEKMQNFLMQTLSGKVPEQIEGHNAGLRWQWLDEGIAEFIPLNPTPMALVLSAGIHGNETAPVEILNQLVNQLIAGKRPLRHRLLVILGNPAALRENRRYLDCDVNRLFGGRWQHYQDTPEVNRARRLEQATKTFFESGHDDDTRWHLDLHTAIRDSFHTRFGVMPLRETPWPEDFLYWLASAGLEALVFHRDPGGTYTHYSSQAFSAVSCTLELGKAQPFGGNDLSQFAAAHAALASLLSGGSLPKPGVDPIHYRVSQQITRSSSAFRLHMDRQTLNFTAFSQGALLAEDNQQRFYVQQACEYVLFPNPDVAQGQRAGLMLIKDHCHHKVK